MHAKLPTPSPTAEPENRFVILSLEGRTLDEAPTYYVALMRGYCMWGCGKFTVQPKKS